nr:hypothetical protein [Tanacetum cinerariifolium]
IIMANVPLNDPNVDASAIVPAPVNLDHAPAQPVEEEEDAKEEEEDPKEDPEEDPEGDDDDMEMDYEAEPILPIASFGQNFHFGESSSTTNLLTGNSKIVLTGLMCLNLETAWKRLGKMEKLMSERINIEGRMKKKFKEQDRHFVGLGGDNIKMDRTMRNVMSDLSRLKKLVKDLNFMKCGPITFLKNEGAIGLIRWIEKTKMVFTVSKCTEANKVVFAAATFQDRTLTWRNSQVATLGIEAVTRKTWAEMKVMMIEEFCPPEEI